MAEKQQVKRSVFGRARSESTKMTTVYDSEGRAVEAESREDEEQNIKQEQTIELLVAAGYFRARIKGLSAFDKVVGGMTWCISTCNVDVDVDLLFQENSTIGQKIALTEKIVVVLPKMKCPHRIEPHQIQGLDFIHIYPVIQWLVKRAMETRAEMGDYIRRFSLSQFGKEHQTPDDLAEETSRQQAESSMKAVKDLYRPVRKFKRQKSLLVDEESKVQSTLLEYGKKHGYAKEIVVEEGETEEQKTETLEELRAQEEEKIEALMSSMAAAKQDGKLAASVVGILVGRQQEEIQQIDSQYAERQQELEATMQKEIKLSGAQQHKRATTALSKQIQAQKAKLEESEKEHERLKSLYMESQASVHEAEERSQKIEAMTKKLEEMETDENREVLDKLRSLVAMNEGLKGQETDFKSHCKTEMHRLKTSIEELANSADNETGEEERTRLIDEQYQADQEKLQKIRLLLARKTREIAALRRKIDEVPSRAELSQYQKRFIELFGQISATHKETKQFYTLYNTLDDTKLYLNKEVNLLNSIHDNFLPAMSSRDGKEQFLKQFEQIVEGIKVNKLKCEKKKQQEKMKRDTLNDQHLELVEKERLYFKTVKDFKEECRKNEILLAKLQEQDA